MNKRTMKLGWLVMAAALTIGMTACSNDDNIIDEPTTSAVPQAVSTVHVTVGAGFDGDDATTRADVVQDGVHQWRQALRLCGDCSQHGIRPRGHGQHRQIEHQRRRQERQVHGRPPRLLQRLHGDSLVVGIHRCLQPDCRVQ